MPSLDSVLSSNVRSTFTDDAPSGDLATGSAASSATNTGHNVRLTDGTAAGQADIVFADTRTLADGASEDIDLAGVLTDAFGATITAARIKAVYVKAADGNTTDLTVGAGTNPWATLLNAAGTITLRPGASFQSYAGEADATAYAVTAGTGDILAVANAAGAAADYDIVIIGASA